MKKVGSFPSVTLYKGTHGDKPSRDEANSTYFLNQVHERHIRKTKTKTCNKSIETMIKQVPGQFQRQFAFPWSQPIDQPKQTPQYVCLRLRYPPSTSHLVKNCRLPQSVIER